MKKLKLNDDIKTFIDTEDREIWETIIESRIESRIESILPDLLKSDNEALKITGEFLSTGTSESLDKYNFNILKVSDSEILIDLVRFLFSVDISGEYENAKEGLINKLLDIIELNIENTQTLTKNNPDSRTRELLWDASVGIRRALTGLSLYFNHKEDIENEDFVSVMRTKLTLSVMSGYKHLVSSDMINSAKIKEKLGAFDVAISLYNVVVSNMEGEMDWFTESPEAAPVEEDSVILASLREAYTALDRLNDTDHFIEKCAVIDEILSREYVDMFEEGEE